jgi:hypothetical protein
MPPTRIPLPPGRHIEQVAALHAIVVEERATLCDFGFVFAPAGVPDDFEGAHCQICGRWLCKMRQRMISFFSFRSFLLSAVLS